MLVLWTRAAFVILLFCGFYFYMQCKFYCSLIKKYAWAELVKEKEIGKRWYDSNFTGSLCSAVWNLVQHIWSQNQLGWNGPLGSESSFLPVTTFSGRAQLNATSTCLLDTSRDGDSATCSLGSWFQSCGIVNFEQLKIIFMKLVALSKQLVSVLHLKNSFPLISILLCRLYQELI